MSLPKPQAQSLEKPLPAVDTSKKYDTVVMSGQSALRALLAMDSGAIIVFATFLGHLWSKDALPALNMRPVVVALVWFISGIFLALVSYCAIFVTNCFSMVNWPRSSNAAMAVTFLSGAGSLFCFPIGCWRAIHAIGDATVLAAR